MDPFRDPALPTAERVADLLSRMTLSEKIGQLNQRLLGWHTWQRREDGFALTDGLDKEIEATGGIGAVYGLLRSDAWSGRDWRTGAGPEESAELTAMVQERIVGRSRLGIPALFAEEAPHGHQALGGQLLPTNIGVAATWRPQLLEEAAAQVATELRARGTHLALVSGLDILRDPRWGRSEECFGEDPLLASAFTRALVNGLQSVPGVGAVLKHFAAQGAGIGGRNGSGAPIGPRELAEIHLPAARAGIEAGAVGVMAAYNDIDGVPCVANADLLGRILRQDWGFGGLVMADMGAIDRLTLTGDHRVAAALALSAGVDLSLCDRAYTELADALAASMISEELIDRACARVLTVKIDLGLLDPPQPAPSFPAPSRLDDLIADTAVLISNDGTLPLLDGDCGRLAVIGPNADDLDALLGDYVPPLPEGTGTTVLTGLRDRFGADRVAYAPGCLLTRSIPGGIDRAVELARAANRVVLVIGSSGQRHYEDSFADNGAADLTGQPVTATTGEGFDVADLELPEPQRDLVAAVAATGTPVIAVIISGRPLSLDFVADRCAAVLSCWYPGPDGGRAVAALLAGDREPAGRLPVSLPRSSGTLPVAYNERVESVSRYIDSETGTRFGFGAGLGYATWSLGPARRTVDGLTAELTNTSNRSGRQVVQLYGRARVAGIQPRRAVLLGFSTAELGARQSATVTVPVRPDALTGLGSPTDGVVDLWLSLTGADDQPDVIAVAAIDVAAIDVAGAGG
ncbi:beta-glucosidase [Microlunatus elymi]|uniref:Beta-glucosidase n=1 Tax=Microlunatus elymi TaxID=2596828 RepID=A0A516Q432_9ACTN|nr:glycoside hydrolase family 3 N-terminal domain-containing protein [Microlunatus elymi]QDP97971.1 beta-glucosidase [Microlunatus elymi]